MHAGEARTSASKLLVLKMLFNDVQNHVKALLAHRQLGVGGHGGGAAAQHHVAQAGLALLGEQAWPLQQCSANQPASTLQYLIHCRSCAACGFC